MKASPISQLARLMMAVIVLAGSTGIAAAGPASTDKALVAHVIELHAPNAATRTTTVWLPAPPSRKADETKAATTVKHGTVKVIELPASNSSIRSVTIWTDK